MALRRHGPLLAALLALALNAGAALAGQNNRAGPEARGSHHRLTLRADVRERGYVGLRLHSAPGTRVLIRELSGRRIARLTPTAASSRVRQAARWLCNRRLRRFVAATSDGQSASTAIRTPSCARRLALVVPRRVHGRPQVKARLVDRWGVGRFVARLCVEPPGGPGRCRRVGLREGQRDRRFGFHARRPGGWLVRAQTEWGRTARLVRAAPPGGRLNVLTTGDSMVQRLDGFLARRLGRRGVRVRRDAYPATGISKTSLLDWVGKARVQAGFGADVVVMFIGANDGFPIGGTACCGKTWRARYARRARSMMAAYARGGRTRILWLLLPTPRGGFARRSFPAVNSALRRAAATARRDVRVVDLGKVFSPGGRYRTWIRVGKRKVGVRQSDGIHLSDQGASIAANIVIRTLRAERILR